MPERIKVYLPDPASFSAWAVSKLESEYELTIGPMEAVILVVRVSTCVDQALLEQMPVIRLVVSATTGTDHIDIGECERRGIDILTLKGETELLSRLPNTAEHAFALLLALYRHLPRARQDVLKGIWCQAPYRGRTLQGKTFGIVGYGRLGEMAGRMARGFEMTVLAYDPEPRRQDGEDVTFVNNVEDLAGSVDVLSLHADLNPTSKEMINAAVFRRMNDAAVLINTARGQLVDQTALLQALESGSISGAALDVIEGEGSFQQGNALLDYAKRHDNLLLTPHIGGQTMEAVEAADKYIFSKIDKWCARNAC